MCSGLLDDTVYSVRSVIAFGRNAFPSTLKLEAVFIDSVVAYFQATRSLNPQYRSFDYHVIKNCVYTPSSNTLQTNVWAVVIITSIKQHDLEIILKWT